MVIKVFLAGISASKEIKKRQQRALLILDSCKVDYESIDITEPGSEEMREFMQQNSKTREPNKTPLAPQFFNENEYCGDYEDFDSAVEINQVLPFLKLESNDNEYSFNDITNEKSTNGVQNNEDEKVDEKLSTTTNGEANENKTAVDAEEGEINTDSLSPEKVDDKKDEKPEETEDGDDGFWAQDDNKKRKSDEDVSKEEVTEKEAEDDASKRLKIDDDGGEEEEEEKEKEEKTVEAVDQGGEENVEKGDPGVEGKDDDKVEPEEKDNEEDEEGGGEEEDDFWGKGD